LKIEVSKNLIVESKITKNDEMQSTSNIGLLKNDSFEMIISNKTNKATDFDKYSERKDHFVINSISKVLTYIHTPKAINKK
jgi:hypothetical protein